MEFSVDDLVAYFTAHDQAKLTLKLRALMQDSDGKLRSMALDAAEKIAAINPLNRMRMESWDFPTKTKGDEPLTVQQRGMRC